MIFLLEYLIIALVIQLIMFVPAFIFRSDKLTDLSYGVTFIVLIFYAFLVSDQTGLKFLLATMIVVWGLRLSSYLFMRILKTKKDERFDSFRGNFFKFLFFWILQGVSVFVILISSLIAMNSDFGNFNYLVVFGFGIWLIGLLIETFADYQKFAFKNNPRNNGKWISTGLWKYSRHPNYFGEFLCWFGIFIFTLPALANFWLVGLISPIYILVLLLFVSGIPTLERKYDEKYKGNKDYKNYKEKTSLFILLPRKK